MSSEKNNERDQADTKKSDQILDVNPKDLKPRTSKAEQGKSNEKDLVLPSDTKQTDKILDANTKDLKPKSSKAEQGRNLSVLKSPKKSGKQVPEDKNKTPSSIVGKTTSSNQPSEAEKEKLKNTQQKDEKTKLERQGSAESLGEKHRDLKRRLSVFAENVGPSSFFVKEKDGNERRQSEARDEKPMNNKAETNSKWKTAPMKKEGSEKVNKPQENRNVEKYGVRQSEREKVGTSISGKEKGKQSTISPESSPNSDNEDTSKENRKEKIKGKKLSLRRKSEKEIAEESDESRKSKTDGASALPGSTLPEPDDDVEITVPRVSLPDNVLKPSDYVSTSMDSLLSKDSKE